MRAGARDGRGDRDEHARGGARQSARALPRAPRPARRRDHERLRRGGLLGTGARRASDDRLPDRPHGLVPHRRRRRRSARRVRAAARRLDRRRRLLAPVARLPARGGRPGRCAERPELAERLEVHLAGVARRRDRAFAARLRSASTATSTTRVGRAAAVGRPAVPADARRRARGYRARDRAGQDVRVPRGPRPVLAAGPTATPATCCGPPASGRSVRRRTSPVSRARFSPPSTGRRAAARRSCRTRA